MSFVLSKIVWALLTPGSLLFLLLLAAWLTARLWPRRSRLLLGVAVLFTGALIFSPIDHWITGPLEQRFPQTPLPTQVDGIIVLGGAIMVPANGQVQLGGAAERITELVALSRRYPQARLLYSGGSGLVRDQRDREADFAGTLFESLGVDRSRLLLERESRNTWENALLSKKLADPKPGENWLLITSAWHMPRSIGCFRAAGWNVVAHPVDYVAAESQWLALDPETTLYNVSAGLKEWIGLLAYHLMHRTDAWFPAPHPSSSPGDSNVR
ncbi:MAG: uncharacterized protein JWR16_1342 [Nevskia sp.]|nr:uncharacterized protein [Nevskia sp.]